MLLSMVIVIRAPGWQHHHGDAFVRCLLWGSRSAHSSCMQAQPEAGRVCRGSLRHCNAMQHDISHPGRAVATCTRLRPEPKPQSLQVRLEEARRFRPGISATGGAPGDRQWQEAAAQDVNGLTDPMMRFMADQAPQSGEAAIRPSAPSVGALDPCHRDVHETCPVDCCSTGVRTGRLLCQPGWSGRQTHAASCHKSSRTFVWEGTRVCPSFRDVVF